MKLKWLIVAIIGLFVCFGCKLEAMANTVNTAMPMQINEKISNELLEGDAIHYYKLTLPSSGTLSIDVKKVESYYSDVYVFDSSMICMFEEGIDSIKEGTISIELTKGTYYVVIEAGIEGWMRDGKGKYSLTPYFASASSTFENNTYISAAKMLHSGESVKGHLAQNAHSEYFKIKISKKGRVKINANFAAAYGFINVYDSKNNLVRDLIVRKSESNGRGSLTTILKKGNYYIEVISYKDGVASGQHGRFGFSITYPSNTMVKSGLKYSLKSNKTATVVGAVDASSSLDIPTTIKNAGITYKITGIEKAAFKSNCRLQKIVIGKNVTQIGKEAFYGCSDLKSINIKTTRLTSKKIGKNAFKGVGSADYKMTTIRVPKKQLKKYKKILRSKGLSKVVSVKK